MVAQIVITSTGEFQSVALYLIIAGLVVTVPVALLYFVRGLPLLIPGSHYKIDIDKADIYFMIGILLAIISILVSHYWK